VKDLEAKLKAASDGPKTPNISQNGNNIILTPERKLYLEKLPQNKEQLVDFVSNSEMERIDLSDRARALETDLEVPFISYILFSYNFHTLFYLLIREIRYFSFITPFRLNVSVPTSTIVLCIPPPPSHFLTFPIIFLLSPLHLLYSYSLYRLIV
jgi:hypothetical protein